LINGPTLLAQNQARYDFILKTLNAFFSIFTNAHTLVPWKLTAYRKSYVVNPLVPKNDFDLRLAVVQGHVNHWISRNPVEIEPIPIPKEHQ